VLAAPASLPAQSALSEEPLGRRISVHFDRTELGAALARLRLVFGVPLAYSADALPERWRVSLDAENQSVSRVLSLMLEGTDLTIVPTAGGTIIITPMGSRTGSDGSRLAVDPSLATGIQRLDQIVVMGTPVAGAPEREQPNAVSVVDGEDLRVYRYSRTADLIRTVLPGVVLWDRGPSGPPAEIAAVRGASSFTARGIKTYVDGVELASPALFTLLDPRSIERIEVIRGPQGAALYGSDAINGIVHIITRKGRIGETDQVKGWASASAGPFDRAALPSTMVRQSHAGSMEWGGSWSALQLDGNLDRVGSGQTAPTTNGWGLHTGGQAAFGSFLVTGSARATKYSFREEGFAFGDQPTVAPSRSAGIEAATLGLTAIHQTTNHWTQTLVLGYDRADGALGTSRPALASFRQPLAATHEVATRRSLRLHSTLDLSLSGTATLAATAGFEHSRLARSRGSWDAAAAQRYSTLYADEVENTGTFVQGKLRMGGLVLTGGLRTEWNSSFGPELGAALASSVGASWAEPVGSATLRVRAGWGRGIRPPEPGMNRGMASALYRQEPNPSLAPEVQAGFEVGADLYGRRGSFVRATLFDQLATDLIQSVVFPAVWGAPQSYQFQNVGAIRNRGLELEAGLRSGPFGADLQLYLTRSTIERLARTYSGFLRVGDRLPEMPDAAGSARLSWSRGQLRLAAGTSFIGSWQGYDWTAMAEAVGYQGQPRPSVEDYLIRYPPVIKPYLMASFDLARPIGAFLVVDNLTNAARFERHNGNPPAGRSALFGIEVRP
jgi:iron complex outermembrane receptor protein